MRYHYVWLIWSSAFLLPWIGLYLTSPFSRTVMWRASLATAVLGLTEPIFVPEYWNPPSLFELAQRTGFDIESLIFSFAIGGLGVALYNAMTRTHLVPVPAEQRTEPLHRFHTIALVVPYAAFIPLALLPWNSIYPAIASLVLGSQPALEQHRAQPEQHRPGTQDHQELQPEQIQPDVLEADARSKGPRSWV